MKERLTTLLRIKSRNLLPSLGAGLTVAAVMASIGMVKADPATGSTGSTGLTGSDRYCSVLIGKSVGEQPSPVLARACDDSSPTKARAKMLQVASQGLPKSTVKSLADTTLMTWYADTDYRGTWVTVTGDAGPCDSAGYRINAFSVGPLWPQILSSARGAGSCNTARFANREGTASSEFRLPVPYLGPLLNDNVGTVWVYNR